MITLNHGTYSNGSTQHILLAISMMTSDVKWQAYVRAPAKTIKSCLISATSIDQSSAVLWMMLTVAVVGWHKQPPSNPLRHLSTHMVRSPFSFLPGSFMMISNIYHDGLHSYALMKSPQTRHWKLIYAKPYSWLAIWWVFTANIWMSDSFAFASCYTIPDTNP